MTDERFMELRTENETEFFEQLLDLQKAAVSPVQRETLRFLKEVMPPMLRHMNSPETQSRPREVVFAASMNGLASMVACVVINLLNARGQTLAFEKFAQQVLDISKHERAKHG